jgi:hypothetical protein
MRIGRTGVVVVLVALALALPGCRRAPAEEEAGASDLATVEAIDGSDVATVTLSQEAADRIDVATAPVTHDGSHDTIPYAAVLYDPSGDTWTYTSLEPLIFVRAPIRVLRIVGDTAVLDDGPPPGTQVVTVGGAELLGTEYEVGEE